MTAAVDHGRLMEQGQPVPAPVSKLIEGLDVPHTERIVAKLIAGHLAGLPPQDLTPAEHQWLADGYGPEHTKAGLHVLAEIGYGPHLRREKRVGERCNHGIGRERRLTGVVGKLPRALALRLPTSADTHRTGRNDGQDRWGRVSCSRTLRPDHLGLLAAIGGLWTTRSDGEQEYLDTTAGELAQLLWGRTRLGGRDLRTIHELLADFEALDLRADVVDSPGKKPKIGPNGEELLSGESYQHRIPSTPLSAVERRIGPNWIPADEYAEALEDDNETGAQGQLDVHIAEQLGEYGTATIRIRLADWVRYELTHNNRRPVFIDLDVWAHLRTQGRRVYAFLQAAPRSDRDGSIYFYLATPTLFTLGLRGRRDRCAKSISDDLSAIVKADRRYERFRRQTHANTTIPAFGVHARQRPSEPTELAKETRALPKRPRALRELTGRLRDQGLLSPHGAAPHQVDLRKPTKAIQQEFKAVGAAIARATSTSRNRRPAVRRLIYARSDEPAAAAA